MAKSAILNGTSRHSATATKPDPLISLEDEEALVGSILLGGDPTAVRPEIFAISAHRHVVGAAKSLFERGEPVDVVLLKAEMQRRGSIDCLGDNADRALLRLFEAVPHVQHLGAYLKQVELLYARRKLRMSAEWIAAEIESPMCDIEDLRARVSEAIEPNSSEHRFRLHGVPFGQFLRQSDATAYLISTADNRGILAERQMCTIAGPSKSLKTSLGGCDLMISVGSGTPFLGEFPTEKRRVAFFSGESGPASLRECCRRICESRGISPASVDASIECQLPRASEPGHLRELNRYLTAEGIEVAILDPAYWICSGAETANSAGNVFVMGEMLSRLRNAIPQTCTPVLIHHFSKGAARNGKLTGEPPQLEDMAQAGFAEHARQWMLIGRRSPYDGESGTHHLWLNVGGSAGHSSLWGIDVREGRQSDMGGRKWAVTVRRKDDIDQEKAELKDFAAESQQADKLEQYRSSVIAFIRKRGAVTKTDMKEVSGVRYQTATAVLEQLIADKEVTTTSVRKNNRTYSGFSLSSSDQFPPVPGTGRAPVVPAPPLGGGTGAPAPGSQELFGNGNGSTIGPDF